MAHLLKEFYKISEISSDHASISAKIFLNGNHNIYEGHFPAIPVVPGVCQMQMIHEILSDVSGKKLNLRTADNMKFMAIINPKINKELQVKIAYKYQESNQVKASSTISFGPHIFFKFSGTFEIAV